MHVPDWTRQRTGHDPRLRAGAIALLALLAVGVYLNSLQNGFALDDVHIIVTNSRVHDLADLRSIWLTPYWPNFGEYLGLYRPLPIFLYAVQWAAGGGEPFVFHATSVLLHVGVTILAFLLLEELATSTAAAFVGALIFAVHPVHVEAVANVVGQAELVAAAATLGACLLHAARPDRLDVRRGRRVGLALLFGIGVFAKESAVVLPGLLVIVDLVQRRVELSRAGLLRYASALAMPLFLMAAMLGFYLVLRYDALGGTLLGGNAGPNLPYLREEFRVLNAFRAFPEYMRLLFFPQDLIADYAPGVILPAERFSDMVVLGAVILAVLIAIAATTPWHAIGFPAAWFLISIVTVSNLFFPVGVLVAERTLYLPSFALSALVTQAWLRLGAGAVADDVGSSRRRRLMPTLVVAIVVVAFCVRTWTRNPDWQDTPAMQRALLRDHPESYKAQWTHAARLAEAGDRAGALRHFELAYRIYHRDSHFLAEYGSFLLTLRQPAPATALLEAAYAMDPDVALTAERLAAAYLWAGRWEDAMRLAREAWLAGGAPHNAMALMAHAYTGLGRYGHAAGAWRTAVLSSPAPSWSHLALYARALALAGQPDEALSAARAARNAAAGDEPVLQLLEDFEVALREGCYAVPDEVAGAEAAGPLACDPLATRIRP